MLDIVYNDPRRTPQEPAYEHGPGPYDPLTHIERTFSDRAVVRLIWFALKRDAQIIAFMDRHAITLDDLWAIVRRGRR